MVSCTPPFEHSIKHHVYLSAHKAIHSLIMRLVSESKCLFRVYGRWHSNGMPVVFCEILLIGLPRNRLGNCSRIAIQGAHAAFLCHLSEGWALKVKLQSEGVL